MREKLIRYVELLFAGVPDSGDIQQEILQNTLDRYDDLVAQGKSPEAAYRLAISGIGDLSEILGEAPPSEAPRPTAPAPEKTVPEQPAWKKIVKAIAVCLYILSPVPLFILQDETGLCGLLAFVAVATALMVFAGSREKEAQAEFPPKAPRSPARRAAGTIIWTAAAVLYLILSFGLNAWYITWLIFPIAGCVQGLVGACMDLKIVRIVLLAILTAILIAALVGGILVGVFSTNYSSSAASSQDQQLSSGEVSAAGVRNLTIEWVSGSITILPDDTDKITFQESGRIRQGDEMIWKQSGNTLTIEYHDSGWSDWHVWLRRLFGSESAKHLIVTVPKDWVCQELTIDSVSAGVQISDLTFQEIDLTIVSGRCDLSSCSVVALSMDTTSGDIHFSGTLQELDVDAVSANCSVTLTNTPRDISLDSVSGDLKLTLPESCGFTASVSSVSGHFTSDFSTSASNGRYIYGSGEAYINANTVSGSLAIYKG